jgi:hypothetical protein
VTCWPAPDSAREDTISQPIDIANLEYYAADSGAKTRRRSAVRHTTVDGDLSATRKAQQI